VESGAEPRKVWIFEHFGASKITSEWSVRPSDMLFFDTAPMSRYVVNEVACKLKKTTQHGLSTSGHRKCGYYVMSPLAHRYGLFETRPT